MILFFTDGDYIFNPSMDIKILEQLKALKKQLKISNKLSNIKERKIVKLID